MRLDEAVARVASELVPLFRGEGEGEYVLYADGFGDVWVAQPLSQLSDEERLRLRNLDWQEVGEE